MIIPGKYSFDVKRVKTVPIKGIDDEHQKTGTFAILMSGKFILFLFFSIIMMIIFYKLTIRH